MTVSKINHLQAWLMSTGKATNQKKGRIYKPAKDKDNDL